MSGRRLAQIALLAVVVVASSTKLMTALVVRSQGADLDSVVTTTRALRRRAGRTRVEVGDRVRMEDLLHLSLMVSDNFATRELADALQRRAKDPAEDPGGIGMTPRRVAEVAEVSAGARGPW